MHNATTMRPTRNVLATWRGMLRLTPPTVAAYIPSPRFARIARPAPSCHSSNESPNSSHFSRTAGQPVVSIPVGKTMWRASSESFPDRVFSWATPGCLLLVTGVDRLDRVHNLTKALRQRGQVTSRRVRVLDRAGDPSPHCDQQLASITPSRRLGDRLRLDRGNLISAHGA